MAVDTPAKIAVIGAGPIGLEAALYARFLGYDVELFDAGDVAENVQRWGHVRLFSPFRMNSTPLGLGALAAQDEAYAPPPPDALLTGAEWARRYLVPLSQTDLLADHLRLHTRVVAVAREDWLKHEHVGNEERRESLFRLLVRNPDGEERETTADVVIDASGVYATPRWLGPGGAPALGELACRERMFYGLPDIAGRERSRFAQRRVLVVGGGYSAATSVLALADLAKSTSSGSVVWAVRAPADADGRGPLVEIPDDPLSERASLVRRANEAALGAEPVTWWPGTVVVALRYDTSTRTFHVTTRGSHAADETFDEVIANVGFRPDHSLATELQLHTCYATDGPMKLAARLQGTTGDCLRQTSHGAESLLNPEPDFYILGAKSYGRNPEFLASIGYRQIRDLFSLIGERETLDLYQGDERWA